MKQWIRMGLAALVAASSFAVSSAYAQETRTIRLVQDDAQGRMATKTYNLKHTRGTDLAPFIGGAVRRYASKSTVRSLNFSAAKQQTLIVTTDERFIPYVDELVAVLDRGTKKDEYGSTIFGSGSTWKVYYPAYRTPDALTPIGDVMLSGNGWAYAYNGTLWLKDDLGDIDYTLEWVRYFDRPIPQANITVRYYSVRESTLRDVGIDYLAWKNGPGMNLLDMYFNSGKIAWDKVFNLAANGFTSASWAYGGIFTAPAFDMSFVRLLQQSGGAKVVATADVNVLNGQEKASLSLTPTYNRITKDAETHASSVKIVETNPEFTVSIYTPCICFDAKPEELNEYGWIPSTPAFYAKNRGSICFAYDVASVDAVEANNYGTQVSSGSTVAATSKVFEFGREQLLASSVREYDVEQTTGVPFLCKLPVLKYIFGTTTTMKEKNYIFVTVEAKLVHPETVAAKK